MILHLRTAFPEQTLVIFDEQLKLQVQAGIIQAMHYDIKMEWDIRRYLEYSLLNSADFKHNQPAPEIIAILTSTGIDGTIKMDRIEQLV